MTAMDFSVKRAVATIAGLFLVVGVCVAVSNPTVAASIGPALRGRNLAQVGGIWGAATGSSPQSYNVKAAAAKAMEPASVAERKLSIERMLTISHPDRILEESTIDGKVHRKLTDGRQLTYTAFDETAVPCPFLTTLVTTGVVTATCACPSEMGRPADFDDMYGCSCAWVMPADIRAAMVASGLHPIGAGAFLPVEFPLDFFKLKTTVAAYNFGAGFDHATDSGMHDPGSDPAAVDSFLETYAVDGKLTATAFNYACTMLESNDVHPHSLGVGCKESLTDLLLPMFGRGTGTRVLFGPIFTAIFGGVPPFLYVQGEPYEDVPETELYMTSEDFRALFVDHVWPAGFKLA